jgi:hypothetical protein
VDRPKRVHGYAPLGAGRTAAPHPAREVLPSLLGEFAAWREQHINSM